MPNDVFISYAREDQDFAHRLTRMLNHEGISASADMDLAPGEDWGQHLRQTLDDADAMVLLVSPDALTNPYVLSEVGAALASDKPIIPVLPPNRRMPRDVPQPIGQLQVLRIGKLSDSEIATRVRGTLKHLARNPKADVHRPTNLE